jgi:hypothetical protein
MHQPKLAAALWTQFGKHVDQVVAQLLGCMSRLFRRRSDSVCFLRSFCRADEATGMPLHDPKCPCGRSATPLCVKRHGRIDQVRSPLKTDRQARTWVVSWGFAHWTSGDPRFVPTTPAHCSLPEGELTTRINGPLSRGPLACLSIASVSAPEAFGTRRKAWG